MALEIRPTMVFINLNVTATKQRIGNTTSSAFVSNLTKSMRLRLRANHFRGKSDTQQLKVRQF